MTGEADGSLAPRVEKLETKVDNLETKVEGIDRRAESTETQLARIVSHIESESLAARSDIVRLEKRLLGPEDAEYGGKIGHLAKKVYSMEIWFRAIIGAAAILTVAFAIYEFFLRVKP